MRRENRGPWYLLTGLIIGLAIGLTYAWKFDPLVYLDNNPASMRVDFKDQYRAAIAAAFMADADLARAQARLNLLEETDPANVLAMQAQQALAEGRPAKEVQALSLLSVALRDGTVPFTPALSYNLPPTPTPTYTPIYTSTFDASPTATFVLVEPSLTPTPGEPVPVDPNATPANTGSPSTQALTITPTITPLPSRTATPAPLAPFVLGEKTQVCDPDIQTPLLIVEAQDTHGGPVSGVEVIVTWLGGEDHFFTGLKPDLGLGYADFVMSPGVNYTLRLAGGGEPISDLTVTECQPLIGDRQMASWRLIFKQP